MSVKNKPIVLITLFISLFVSCSNEIPFNKNKWSSKHATESHFKNSSLRQRMVKDALTKISGKSPAQIELMLGKSDTTENFSNMNPDFIYLLGPDNQWLLLWFNDKNKLVRYEILTD